MSEPIPLRRTVSLPLLTFYGLGNILGAGIYVLVGKVAGNAGMLAPLSFLLASGVAAFSALTYGELSARFPLSAGEAVYLQQGLGLRWLSVTVGLLIALAGVVSAAAIVRGFVGYLHQFVHTPDVVVITLLVATLGTLAAWGISESLRVAATITLIEVGGLLLVMWATSGSLATLPERLGEFAPRADWRGWQGTFLGTFLAFYAFIGFEDMVNVAEEVRRPTRTLPLAIIIALVLATLLYLTLATAAVLTVPPAELAVSDAPLALVYQRATGQSSMVISAISLFAVVNGALIQIIMASRIFYGMSRQGWLPAAFQQVHPLTQTPLIATAVVTLGVLLLALSFPIIGLAGATSLLILVVFALVNLALLRMKSRETHPPDIRTYPRWVPAIGLLASLALILAQALSTLP